VRVAVPLTRERRRVARFEQVVQGVEQSVARAPGTGPSGGLRADAANRAS
jgi:hypothetical protein